jgi:hypothetical protein
MSKDTILYLLLAFLLIYVFIQHSSATIENKEATIKDSKKLSYFNFQNSNRII